MLAQYYYKNKKQQGVSMVETLLVLPMLLMVGFGVVHLGFVFQAQSNLEYAALMAARTGAASNIDLNKMKAEVLKRMNNPCSVGEGEDEDQYACVKIEVLNPTVSMFVDCGEEPTDLSVVCDSAAFSGCEIPNALLQYRSGYECDGTTIQDANLLRIKVSYDYDSGVIFMNNIQLGDESVGSHVVLTAVATVRMQSAGRLTVDNAPAFGL